MQKLCVNVFILCACLLTGCNVSNQNAPLENSNEIQAYTPQKQIKTLAAWWSYFNDPVLDRLVSATVKLQMQGADFKGEKAVLVSDVVKIYLQYRSLQGQSSALSLYMDDISVITSRLDTQEKKNLITQLNQAETDISAARKTQDTILKEMGGIQQELAENSGLLPEYIAEILKESQPLPDGDIKPVLITPADDMAYIPEVTKKLNAYSGASKSIFPSMIIGDFFGVSTDAYTDETSKWSVDSGTFERHLNWVGIENEGNITGLKNDISDFLFDFQGKLISYADLGVQYETLNMAHENAINEKAAFPTHNSRNDSASLGAALSMQKKVYDTNIGALKAKYERIKILIDLYTLFNVY